MVKLLPELVRRGIRVSTMKHAHHNFDVDKPGKDSWEHRQAGATEVLVSSERRWALMHELRAAPEATVDDLVRHMTPVDLLLIEGFKTHDHDKLEVYRASVGKPPLHPEDRRIVAIASDAPVQGARLPLLSIDDVPAIAGFIVQHCGLAGRS